MRRIVLVFGLLSGLITAAMLVLTVPRGTDAASFEHAELVGYSTMVLAFLLVFFGIRSYRQSVGGGAIGFGRAFKVGILITLVSCAVYVATWQVYYFNFAPDFAERYTARTLEKMKEEGAAEAAIAAERDKLARFAQLYKNPFVNVGITFLEIFPVGLVMTLVSAGILRRKEPAEGASGA